MQYDALLVVSFGGPDGPDDVIPFLENVLRGKHVPRERMLEVADHYQHFGGKSPINEQNLALIAALEKELAAHGPQLPIYFGNRNWHPLLPDALAQMRDDGVKRALAFFTSAFSSYSGCRQYRENLEQASAEIGVGAPQIDILRKFYNHPGFIEPMAEALKDALTRLPRAEVLFAAHSIPSVMAQHCNYEAQLAEACGLVAEKAGVDRWELVYQSRSGPPQQPWLEPDICDRIEEKSEQGLEQLAIVPIGFISDHLEVLYDLDTEAVELCHQKGIAVERVPTVGVHPKFVAMIAELIRERMDPGVPRRCLGGQGPSHDVCPADCCLYPATRPPRAAVN